MSRVAWIIMLAALAAVPADAQTTIPDLPGTWNGESESIVLGGGNSHHPATSGGRTAPDQRSIHLDHRQAGRPPLLRHVLVGAGQRGGHRRRVAQRLDLLGRRRRLWCGDDTRSQPAGTLLHAAVAGLAHRILRGAEQPAIAPGAPYGNRTRVSAVKGRRPRPLDEGRFRGAATYRGVCRVRQGSADCDKSGVSPHHFPVFGIEAHGSFGGSGAPFCSSSIECLSGERTNAITPSRGGRLMVTPAFISFSHSP